jgi:protein gp37
MGKYTGITWTDHTWNPWIGCTKVSEGCRNCYMYRDAKRYGFDPEKLRVTKPATFNSPKNWKDGMVFVCSWSDFFRPDVPVEWLDAAWKIMKDCTHLTFQLCTKRPQEISMALPREWGNGSPNVWLGVTVEDQKHTDRIGLLDDIPAVIKFISYEPAIEAVDFYNYKFDWLISGGESGPDARLADMQWFRDTRNYCRSIGAAYFHKQNGGTQKLNGVWGGDLIDGVQYHEFPGVSHA